MPDVFTHDFYVNMVRVGVICAVEATSVLKNGQECATLK